MPTDPPAPFTGFGPQTVDFLAELRDNNDRAWLDANRDRYLEHWVAPARSFVVAAGEALREIAPDVVAEPKVNGSIFRINRDTRFTKDKAPYKDHLDLFFWDGVTRGRAVSGFYLRVTPEHVGLGVGAHGFQPAQLAKYREAVAGPVAGHALREAVAKVERAGFPVKGVHYKRTPAGHDTPQDPDLERLLRHNALSTGQDLDHPKVLGQKRFVAWCVSRWTKQLPLHRWLVEHVQ